MMKAPSQSRLKKIGILLLPCLPAGVVFAIVWSYLCPPAPVMVSRTKMIGDAPTIYYSVWEQAEQAYPHIRVFFTYLLLAGLAFILGITVLMIGFLRRRNPHMHTTPTT
jgi:hypothetical protein